MAIGLSNVNGRKAKRVSTTPSKNSMAVEEQRAVAAEPAEMKSNGTLQYILNRWIPVRVEVR